MSHEQWGQKEGGGVWVAPDITIPELLSLHGGSSGGVSRQAALIPHSGYGKRDGNGGW